MSYIIEKYGQSSQFFESVYSIIRNEGERLKLENDEKYIESYRTWQHFCEQFYESAQITPDLFYRHCYFIFMGKWLLNQLILNRNHEIGEPYNSWTQIDAYLSERNVELPKILKKIYNWFINFEESNRFLDIFRGNFREIENRLNSEQTDANRYDIFGELYENLFQFDTRHKTGEYYTEEYLAKAMVEDQYSIGQYCLDPACGSGVFLLYCLNKIISSDINKEQKIQAIRKVYGMDINPFALFASILNLVLFSSSKRIDCLPNLMEGDFLFSDFRVPQMDLVIGNPPWVVINGLKSSEYSQKMKKLGADFGIIRGAKYATSTEICTIFVYRALQFLKEEGKVFFITPASLLNGEQHARFRQFRGLGKIKVWLFEKDIFRIHSICFLAAKKREENTQKIQAIKMGFTKQANNLIPKETLYYKPSYIETKSNDEQIKLVGRYIPESKATTLPRVDSEYIHKFRQGASLVPRSLILVRIKSQDDHLATIEPDPDLISKSDANWVHCSYEETKVEKQYIFRVVKSTDMIPFALLSHNLAFLPIETNFEHTEQNDNKLYTTKITRPLALNHFQRISQLYEENQKDNAKILTLEQRLNYGSALTKPEQHQAMKVIYAGIGTIVKACFLKEPFIIDTSVYYYVPESEQEGYYLLAYLNSNIITENVRLIGSTGQSGSLRNIHKTPLKFGLKKFEPKNEAHLKLAELGKSAETLVNKILNNTNLNRNKECSRIKIQNMILQDSQLKAIVREIDKYIQKDNLFDEKKN